MWFALKECNDRKEDAEDLIQDLLLRMMPYASRFEALPENEKINYLFMSIRNHRKDRLKKLFSAKRDSSNNLLAKYQSPEAYGIIELKEVKKRARENVNWDLLMMQSEGYTTREIVTIKSITQNCALGRIHRARKFLKG